MSVTSSFQARLAVSLARLALGTLLITSACAGLAGQGGGQQIAVTMVDFRFEPPNVSANLNQPVRVTAQNSGTVVHNWTVEGMNPQVQATANPGQSATVQFTPNQAGTFRVICTEPGHAELGMVGQLVVQG